MFLSLPLDGGDQAPGGDQCAIPFHRSGGSSANGPDLSELADLDRLVHEPARLA